MKQSCQVISWHFGGKYRQTVAVSSFRLPPPLIVVDFLLVALTCSCVSEEADKKGRKASGAGSGSLSGSGMVNCGGVIEVRGGNEYGKGRQANRTICDKYLLFPHQVVSAVKVDTAILPLVFDNDTLVCGSSSTDTLMWELMVCDFVRFLSDVRWEKQEGSTLGNSMVGDPATVGKLLSPLPT